MSKIRDYPVLVPDKPLHHGRASGWTKFAHHMMRCITMVWSSSRRTRQSVQAEAKATSESRIWAWSISASTIPSSC